MAEDSRPMTPDELRDLLDGRHLAVITTNGPDGTPHSTPVWYLPEGDAVGIIADAASIKVRNLERDPRVSVVVASEGRPYRYVLWRGVADLVARGVEDWPRRMAERYLGKEGATRYLARTAPHPPFVVIKVRPSRTTTWIFTAED